MRKLQLKLWLFTLLLTVGGVSPTWAQDTYEILYGVPTYADDGETINGVTPQTDFAGDTNEIIYSRTVEEVNYSDHLDANGTNCTNAMPMEGSMLTLKANWSKNFSSPVTSGKVYFSGNYTVSANNNYTIKIVDSNNYVIYQSSQQSTNGNANQDIATICGTAVNNYVRQARGAHYGVKSLVIDLDARKVDYELIASSGNNSYSTLTGSVNIPAEVVDVKGMTVTKTTYDAYLDNLAFYSVVSSSCTVTTQFVDENGLKVFEDVVNIVPKGESFTPTYVTTYNPGFYIYTYKEGGDEIASVNADQTVTIVYTKTLKAAYTAYTLGGEGNAPFLLDYDEYGTSTSGWKTSTSGRYDPVLLTNEDNHYFSVNQANRQNNGATVTGTIINGKVAANTDFTLCFDLQLTAAKDRTTDITTFTINDAANAAAILSFTASATGSTTWKINGSDDVTATLATGTWYSVKVTRSADITYCTITKKSDGTNVLLKEEISKLSETGGLGNMVLATARYNANIALDNIIVRDVVESEDIPSAATTYTIKFVKEDGTSITDKDDVVIETYVNEEVTAAETYLATFELNGKKYVYKEGNEPITTVADAERNIITLKFYEYSKWSYTVTTSYNDNTLPYEATGSVWEDDNKVYVQYPRYQLVGTQLVERVPRSNELNAQITVANDDYTTDFAYTAVEGKDNIYLLSEAENLEGTGLPTNGTSFTKRVSGGNIIYGSSANLLSLPVGKYIVTVGVIGGDNSSHKVNYVFYQGDKDSDSKVQIGAGTCTGNMLYNITCDEINISETTTISMTCSDPSSSRGIDLVYVQKTGEYVEPATANYHVYKEGVEVAAGTDYFLYNLGAKKFLDNGMDWGTHATVDNSGRKITFAALNDGKYSIYTETYSLNNSAEARSGFMTTNGYCDTGENDANWEFTPVSVDGYTNVYTIKNSDTQYLIYNSADARVNVGESTNDNNSYWIVVPKSARDAVNDVTYLLMNTDFNRPWERAVWSGSTGTNDKFTTGGAASNRCGEKFHAVFNLYQDIAATPANGKYVLHAQGFYRLDGGSDPAYLYINDNKVALKVLNGEGEGTAESMDGASASFSAGLYKSEVTSIVTNNTMRVGIKNDNAENWLIWDNFYLEYLGTTLINDAVALPEGGAMEAGKWYYIDIAAAANNYVATATTLSDIIYTTDGTMLTADAAGVTNHFTAEDNTLTAGRYYVMSTTANSLEISIPSFTYTVGTAVASQNYIQAGNVVTVTYADLATNNPDVKEATINFSGVTFGGNAQEVTPTANGFTFTVPAVTANTEYTLAIPAGAIGYAVGDTYNEAQNIVVKTPALLDGTYFLKVENETAAKGKYLARGRSYGTHATVDKYGLPIVITTNSENVSTLMAADTRRFYYHGNSWDCWADNASGAADVAKFTITMADDKYRIHNNAMADGTYLKYNNTNVNDENIPVYDDGTGSNSGPIIDWSVELPAEHATAMQSMKDTQAATAAAAAYASGDYESLNGITTVEALEAELTANYIQGDFVAPSAIESISEKFQGGQPGSENTMETVYSNSIEITKAGFYKFSMQAFYRAASNDVTQAMHTAGVDFPPVFLFFGDAQTQIKSVYDDGGIAQEDFETETVGGAPVEYNGKYYTNGQHNSVIVFQNNYYHNDVWVYISEPGTYYYGVKYTGFANANSQWFIYSPESVTITSYAAAATDDDYTAMNSAIENAKAKTLGFDENEYAPYNNIANIEAIATAEAINQEATNSQLLIRSLTETLNNWTKNNADVDAVYNGSFATVTEGADYPKGWTRTNGWGQMQSGLAGDYATAYYNQPGSLVYGNTGIYTMPLNENTLYKLTIAYRSHEDNSNNGLTVSVLKDEEGLAATKFAGNGSKTDWVVVTKYFTTGAAGNYVLTLNNDGNTWMTGVSITKAQAEDITISEEETYAASTTTERYGNVTFNRTLVEGWNGLVLPFDMTVTGIKDKFSASKVKNFTGISYDPAKGVTLNFDNFDSETTVIPAGTPFLVKVGENPAASYEFNGMLLPATGLQNIKKTADGYTNIQYTMKGTYAATTELTNVSFALIQGNTFFYHDGAAAKTSSAKAFRAYFENESTNSEGARVSFDFGDDETTGITELAQPKTAADGTAYDLQGRKVENFKQKGIYIVNGRKVVK